jgi:hypothetical protein
MQLAGVPVHLPGRGALAVPRPGEGGLSGSAISQGMAYRLSLIPPGFTGQILARTAAGGGGSLVISGSGASQIRHRSGNV